MGLDIYVMPLHRFFAGGYTSPLEEAFGSKVTRVGAEMGDSTMEESIASVVNLQEALKGVLGLNSMWEDEGDTSGEQFNYGAFNSLRAFAAHQDHPKTKGLIRRVPLDFDPQANGDDHPGLGKIWKGAATRFPHLIQHADNQGFWFPMDFEHPLNLDQETGLYAGSSFRLREELAQLKGIMGLEKSWGNLQDGETIADESDPMGTIKYACALMSHYADLSCDQSLPIVFDG